MARHARAVWWLPAVGMALLAGCGADPGVKSNDGTFVGAYVLTIFPSAECALPASLAVNVTAAMLQAVGPGNRLEVTLRPRPAAGKFALTVDLLYDKMTLRGGMTAGKLSQCPIVEQDCGVATVGQTPYRLHLEGIAQGAVEATANGGRIGAGTLNGDILLSRPGETWPDTLGACSSDTHRWTLEPEEKL